MFSFPSINGLILKKEGNGNINTITAFPSINGLILKMKIYKLFGNLLTEYSLLMEKYNLKSDH